MMKIASLEDFENCFKLLEGFVSNKKNINPKKLYLNDQSDGFTVIIMQNQIPVAISTFSYRKKIINDRFVRLLYWENLFVHPKYRGGIYYLKIIGFLKNKIKSKEYNDIYFLVRRKEAIKTHRAMNFKTTFFVLLKFKNIYFNSKKIDGSHIKINYHEFESFFSKLTAETQNKILTNLSTKSCWKASQLFRQLKNKNGFVIYDEINQTTTFIRNIFNIRWFSVNIIMNNGRNDNFFNKESMFPNKGLSINFELCKTSLPLSFFEKYASLIKYEMMSLHGTVNLDNFQLVEHDAW